MGAGSGQGEAFRSVVELFNEHRRQTSRRLGGAEVRGVGGVVPGVPASGGRVTLVGPEAGKVYPSKLGYPAKADAAAADVTAADFDALVIPGGFAPDYIRRSDSMLNLVRGLLAAGKPVAAVCHGPWVLCST